MKKTNKGFSMVELIIVIAIMAVLAGALAPALIKYINKSRISTDIQTGQTIATAITTALSNETAYDKAPTLGKKGSPVAASDLITSDEFGTEFTSALGQSTVPNAKSKKDMKNTSFTSTTFGVVLSPTSNLVEVYLGDSLASHKVYPDVGANLK